MPIPAEEKSNIRKALDLITKAAIEQSLNFNYPKKDYSAKLIHEAITVLHNELDKIYNDKVQM